MTYRYCSVVVTDDFVIQCVARGGYGTEVVAGRLPVGEAETCEEQEGEKE